MWYSAMQRRIKRLLDVSFAASLALFTLPVWLIVALAIRLSMGRPVLFKQMRPGYLGRPFYVVKFRTMSMERDSDGQLLPTHQRLTLLGRTLRRYSIDELPQLWNVIKGDMSLIGPRPLLMSYLDKYTPEQMRRHEMRPGVTGLAQVNGRQDIPFSKRLEYDVWYVTHWSLWLDFKILVRTLAKVLRASGVRPGQDVREVDDLGLNVPTTVKEEKRDIS